MDRMTAMGVFVEVAERGSLTAAESPSRASASIAGPPG